MESRWGARFSAFLLTSPGAHPASFTMATGSFPGIQLPGRGVDHPPPSSDEVKERVELCLCSPSRPSWPILGRGELSYLAPLGSENISAPYFKQCFFRGGVLPPRQSNTTPPSPKTEITNILFYVLNFASIIKFKM